MTVRLVQLGALLFDFQRSWILGLGIAWVACSSPNNGTGTALSGSSTAAGGSTSKGPQGLAPQPEAAVEVALAPRVLPGARAQVPVATPPPAPVAAPSRALPAAPQEVMLAVRAVEPPSAATTQVWVIRASMTEEDCLR